MALENRVKTLEDELGILKDQIRNTLLEIQEQILFHYYPDLRAQEAPAPDAAAPALRGNGSQHGAASFSGVQRVTMAELEPAPAVDAPALRVGSLVRSDALRSLSDAGDAPEAALPPEGTGAASLAPPEAESTDWGLVARLTEWAGGSVQKIGKERTIRAIEIYANAGYLDQGVRDALLQLIELSDDEPPAERVRLRVVLELLLKLNEALGRDVDVAATRRLVEEVKVG
ncbi:MAG TPA: hypothetical protein PLB78_03000 [Anaerolineae bacterium]|nr:hypothetical protein [Anaerolineae bacterium]